MPVLLSLVVVVLLVGPVLVAWWSHRATPAAGLVDGRLRPCPDTPNCVSSEASAPRRAMIAPITYTGDAALAWDQMKAVVVASGGRVEHQADVYLWATFRTTVLRFVDDVELRLDRAHRVIHVRSASRVGHTDFGKNRRRVEMVRKRFAAPVP